jgi:hypothetical protein
MADRRSLSEGLKATPAIDPAVAREFIHNGKPPTEATRTQSPAPDASPPAVSRAPISTRIRADYAAALKRASLERQLKGVEPNTLQDILEQAIEPWLRTNGYMP